MRVFLIISFVVLIVASLIAAGTSFYQKEWESLTASFSLTIAIISAWVAYEGFYKQYLHSRAQIVLMPDFKSRAGLIQLVVKNHGQSPAFKIKILWDSPLIGNSDKPVTFNKVNNDIDIAVLNSSESASTLIDSTTEFFRKNKEKNLDFSGKIVFQESLNSARETTQSFQFSLRHHGASLLYDEESISTMVKLQKIPDALSDINKELVKIRKSLNPTGEE
jgi:hypothetical protein